MEGWEADTAQAWAEHESNPVDVTAGAVHTKDTPLIRSKSGKNFTAVESSINSAVVSALKKQGTKVYLVGGFYDGKTAGQLARLHADLGANSRLTLGPWGHAGLGNNGAVCMGPRTKSQYSVPRDMRRFFGCQLQGRCDDVDLSRGLGEQGEEGGEEGVSYYSAGEDGQWRTATTWPPPEATTFAAYRMTKAGVMVDTADADADASGALSAFKVDPAATSGRASRWNLVAGMFGQGVSYTYEPGNAQAKRLTFTSASLAGPRRMAGSAVVTIKLELVGGDDAAVFAYLEEVAADGSVRYVTEGQVLASHRVSTAERQGETGGSPASARRSYTAEDSVPLAGAVAVQLLLEPVAYTFAAGSKIRVAFAGADRDNFDTSALGTATEWRVHLGGTSIELPVVP